MEGKHPLYERIYRPKESIVEGLGSRFSFRSMCSSAVWPSSVPVTGVWMVVNRTIPCLLSTSGLPPTWVVGNACVVLSRCYSQNLWSTQTMFKAFVCANKLMHDSLSLCLNYVVFDTNGGAFQLLWTTAWGWTQQNSMNICSAQTLRRGQHMKWQ